MVPLGTKNKELGHEKRQPCGCQWGNVCVCVGGGGCHRRESGLGIMVMKEKTLRC